MKIFLTGSEGFIGSHLVEELVAHGHRVTALVKYNFQNSWGLLDDIDPRLLKKVNIVSGDIRNVDSIDYYVKNADVIINLAALIGIPYSYISPSSYIDTNIVGTNNLLSLAKKYKVKHFIQTSTSEVYGTADYVPMDENHNLKPQSPYSATKIASDNISLSYFYSYGLPVTILRPFNVFGPRQSSRAVIPTLINQFLDNGKKLNCGSISPTRDYTFVKDTVRGFRMALGKKETIGKTINLGSNFEISIKEIIQMLSEIFDKKPKIIIDKRRVRPKKSEVQRLYSCNSKAKKILKWFPSKKSKKGFKDNLITTVKWFAENNSKYKNLYNL